ncbi:MAG TPA: fibro-slime domain-containing protein, partial [Chitinivibrionales bacterium]|nr:fibro-slime domain-containing protein [Chitinivibrionales bacterium]
MKKVIAACCLFLLYASARVGAQNYPATLNVPIDIFDYHSDGSCPDFNPGKGVPNVWLTNLVQDTLDQDGLPVRGTALLYSWELGKWWRQWRQGNDFERPVYATGGRTVNQLTQVLYDTSYKNILVRQNLNFTYINGSQGQYQYQNGNFFPLDNAGFQANGNPPDPTVDVGGNPINRANNTHNYSFATHIHRIFKYVNGTMPANQLIFEFRGDDDLWVFINSHLVLDLGGIHTTIHGAFVLANGNAVVWENFKNNDMSDTMTAPAKSVVNLGLKDSSTASIDVFFCERQSTGSDLEVTSNIITAPPQTLTMQTIPATDTIAAGDSMQMFATILDDTGGVRPEYANLVTWTLLPTGTRSKIKTLQGGLNTFYAVDAYKWYYTIGQFIDPTNPGRIILDTVKVYVVPAAPSHLTIEASPDSTKSLNADNRLGSITMPSTTQKDSVYAVLRDRFGNFVSHATLAVWVSDNTNVVTVAPGRTSLGEGVNTRQTNQPANTYVVAAQNGWTDSVQVILSNITYSQIQIVGRLTGTSTIDSITSLQMR